MIPVIYDSSIRDPAPPGATPLQLTEEDVEQGEEAEGDGDGELGVPREAQDQCHGAAQQEGEEDHQPGELEQGLDLLARKRLHLVWGAGDMGRGRGFGAYAFIFKSSYYYGYYYIISYRISEK